MTAANLALHCSRVCPAGRYSAVSLCSCCAVQCSAVPAFYPVQCSAGGGGGPRQAVAATRLEQIPGQLSRALSGGGVRGDHPSPPTSSQLSPSLLRCCHTTTREVTDCAADISGSSGHCDQYQHNKEVNSELRAAQFLCRDRPILHTSICPVKTVGHTVAMGNEKLRCCLF